VKAMLSLCYGQEFYKMKVALRHISDGFSDSRVASRDSAGKCVPMTGDQTYTHCRSICFFVDTTKFNE